MAKGTFRFCSIQILVWSFLIPLAISFTPNEPMFITFLNKEQLDPNGFVWLGWEFQESPGIITFQMEVNSRGWVGLGISPNRIMDGADMFIAGVNLSGSTYGIDLFGVGQNITNDLHQDWNLISGREASGRTFLIFSRLLDTGDVNEDYQIGFGESKVIWAYGEDDTITNHAPFIGKRGSKDIDLIKIPTPTTTIMSSTTAQVSTTPTSTTVESSTPTKLTTTPEITTTFESTTPFRITTTTDFTTTTEITSTQEIITTQDIETTTQETTTTKATTKAGTTTTTKPETTTPRSTTTTPISESSSTTTDHVTPTGRPTRPSTTTAEISTPTTTHNPRTSPTSSGLSLSSLYNTLFWLILIFHFLRS